MILVEWLEILSEGHKLFRVENHHIFIVKRSSMLFAESRYTCTVMIVQGMYRDHRLEHVP